MSRAYNEIDAFIASLKENELLIYFGCGEIGVRTAKKFGRPNWSIDNSQSIQGGSYGELRDIRHPDTLKSLGPRAKVVICSVAETEIKQQLLELGVPPENIVISPYARSIAPAEKLYSLKMSVLLASGGPSDDSQTCGGGIYLLSIDGDSVAQEKLCGITSHGFQELGQGEILACTDSGLVRFNHMNNTVSDFASLPKGIKPHGITLNEENDTICVVGNSQDALITLTRGGQIVSIDRVLRGKKNSGVALHHINDIAFSNGALYLSMFSFSGSWKSGVYDGGIYAFDAKSLEPIAPAVSGATMPHSVRFRDDELWFCNSLPGLLTKGNGEFELAFPTFARGLDFYEDLAVVGGSRNRNLRDISLETGTQVREVNSGVYITLMESGLSRFVPLVGSIPEVHAVKIISVGQSKNG